ncbi:Synaptotagmin-like protein 5, partial [Fragariocoptes setiger]
MDSKDHTDSSTGLISPRFHHQQQQQQQQQQQHQTLNNQQQSSSTTTHQSLRLLSAQSSSDSANNQQANNNQLLLSSSSSSSSSLNRSKHLEKYFTTSLLSIDQQHSSPSSSCSLSMSTPTPTPSFGTQQSSTGVLNNRISHYPPDRVSSPNSVLGPLIGELMSTVEEFQQRQVTTTTTDSTSINNDSCEANTQLAAQLQELAQRLLIGQRSAAYATQDNNCDNNKSDGDKSAAAAAVDGTSNGSHKNKINQRLTIGINSSNNSEKQLVTSVKTLIESIKQLMDSSSSSTTTTTPVSNDNSEETSTMINDDDNSNNEPHKITNANNRGKSLTLVSEHNKDTLSELVANEERETNNCGATTDNDDNEPTTVSLTMSRADCRRVSLRNEISSLIKSTFSVPAPPAATIETHVVNGHGVGETSKRQNNDDRNKDGEIKTSVIRVINSISNTSTLQSPAAANDSKANDRSGELNDSTPREAASDKTTVVPIKPKRNARTTIINVTPNDQSTLPAGSVAATTTTLAMSSCVDVRQDNVNEEDIEGQRRFTTPSSTHCRVHVESPFESILPSSTPTSIATSSSETVTPTQMPQGSPASDRQRQQLCKQVSSNKPIDCDTIAEAKAKAEAEAAATTTTTSNDKMFKFKLKHKQEITGNEHEHDDDCKARKSTANGKAAAAKALAIARKFNNLSPSALAVSKLTSSLSSPSHNNSDRDRDRDSNSTTTTTTTHHSGSSANIDRDSIVQLESSTRTSISSSYSSISKLSDELFHSRQALTSPVAVRAVPLLTTVNGNTTAAAAAPTVTTIKAHARRTGPTRVSGEVLLSVNYEARTSSVLINVQQCRNLAAVDKKRSRSNPYVKVYLLPDKSKSGKRKSALHKHQLNPVINEIFAFANLTLRDLDTRTIWLSVWHRDKFGRNEFLGELHIPLQSYQNIVNKLNRSGWYALHERLALWRTHKSIRSSSSDNNINFIGRDGNETS